MCLRKADLDRRFPGLIDSIVSADTEPAAQRRGYVWPAWPGRRCALEPA
jgi:hypothetical protein